MTKRKLKLYDPRVRTRERSGVTIHRSTVALVNEVRAWLLAELWANPHLRPKQWDGKLSQDEALRLMIRGFAEAYGVPLNTDPRSAECDVTE